MSPFLEDDNNDDDQEQLFLTDHVNRSRHRNNSIFDIISQNYGSDDKRVIIFGIIAAMIGFLGISFVIFKNASSVDNDNVSELPLIKAQDGPLKIKPAAQDNLVAHQDKSVYSHLDKDLAYVSDKVQSRDEHTIVTEKKISEQDIENNGSLSNLQKEAALHMLSKATGNNYDDIDVSKGKRSIEKLANSLESASTKSSRSAGIKSSSVNDIIIVEDTENTKVPVNKNAVNKKKAKKSKIEKTKNVNAKRMVGVKKTTPNSKSYSIQVASSTRRNEAERQLRKFSSYKNFLKIGKIVKIDMGKKNGVTYKVRFGPFFDKKDANAAVLRLKKYGHFSFVV